METMQGQSTDIAPGSGHVVNILLPKKVELSDDGGFALLMRHII